MTAAVRLEGPPPNTNGKASEPATKPTTTLGRLGDVLVESIERAERRSAGTEKPIELPWKTLAPHFGGGLWPGLHVWNSGTGVGKTQAALQVAVHAAKAEVPTLFIGLELGQLDLALRVLGNEAGVPWAKLWTGHAGKDDLERVRVAGPKLEGLPFFYEVAKPHGFAPSAIAAAVEELRRLYPEEDGPGSRPLLVVLDFLQLVGDEAERKDLREKIGRAAYVLRDLANRLGAAVVAISSIARDRYKLLEDIRTAAGLTWDADENECPIHRRIRMPDAIVGAGKESGEIEFSADSVSIIAKVAETWVGDGCDVIFATAKGRATGVNWSPLHFTGFAYTECSDRGGRILEAWKRAADRRAEESERKKDAKEKKRDEKIDADARRAASYILANDGCTVTSARTNALAGNGRRWVPAIARLGAAYVNVGTGNRGVCRIDSSKLKPEHRPEGV